MRHILLLALVAALPALAHAQQQPAGGDPTRAVAQAVVEGGDVDVTQNINDQMDAYLEKSGFQKRAAQHELSILRGTSAVLVPSTDRDWVLQRSAAYDDALLQAESRYVQQQGLRITDETTQELFKAANQVPPAYSSGSTPGKEAELLRKIIAVANGTLDGELRKLGVDPKDYNEAPPPQRLLQLQNALKRRTVRQAAGELTGLLPVQTFEGQDGKGNYTIGVVAVVSPLLKDLARQVKAAHGQLQPDPSRAQDLTLLYVDRGQLIHDFGVRALFDDTGLPVLVSFAQSASSYAGGDPAVADQYKQVAMEQAESKADAQIAEFLSGSMEFTSESETGRSLEKAAERLPDGYVQDDAAAKTMVDGLMTTLRARASAQVTGIRTLHSWSGKYPDTGQKIIGVIRMWSAGDEKAVRTLRDQHGTVDASPAIQQPQGVPFVTKGRDLMNAGDF